MSSGIGSMMLELLKWLSPIFGFENVWKFNIFTNVDKLFTLEASQNLLPRIQGWSFLGSFNAHCGLGNYCWNFTWIYSAKYCFASGFKSSYAQTTCTKIHPNATKSIKKNSSHEGIPHNETSKLLPASLACTFNFLILCNMKRAITAQNGRKTICI